MVKAAFETEIIILLLFLGLIFVSMMVVYARNRLAKNVRETYTMKLCECLQPQDSLPDVRFPDIQYLFHRRVLIRLIGDLTVMLEGVEARILQLVFHSNGLYHHILRECRTGNDMQKVRAISVYLDLPIQPNMMVEISRYLDSENHELRMVTLLIWLNMDPAGMIEKLVDYPHTLSDRDCANIYSLFNRRHVAPEEAVKLLESPNPSVLRFGKQVQKLSA